MPTYVMTSFRDSIAFSSVILSGLSSDVCFLMSAAAEGEETERKQFVGERNSQGEREIMERKVKECREQGGRCGWRRMRRRRHREGRNYTGSFCVKLFFHCWLCVCVCVLPLRRRATLGSLCTGLMSRSTSVCLPHSGLAWLICTTQVLLLQIP